jgi:hypothetical protein
MYIRGPAYISTTPTGPGGRWGTMLMIFIDNTCMQQGFDSYEEAVFVDHFLRGYFGWYD